MNTVTSLVTEGELVKGEKYILKGTRNGRHTIVINNWRVSYLADKFEPIPTTVKYVRTESGLCRKYYRAKDKRLFCLTDDGTWFLCSKDGEPSHEVTHIEIIT